MSIISKHAFFGCKQLRLLSLHGVKEICDMAFMNCNKLIEVWVPKSVEKICAPNLESVFGQLIEEIYYEGSAEEWEK